MRRRQTPRILLVLLIGLLSAGQAHALDPRPAAEGIAKATHQQGDTLVSGTAKPRVADGWYVVLSWSVPDDLRHELIEGARQLGAAIVVNGMIGRNMGDTMRTVRAVTAEQGDHPVRILLDPIRIREWRVTTAPALVLRQGDRYLAIEGGEAIQGLLRELAREVPGVKPTQAWWERQPGLWWDTKPGARPRPPLPAIAISANYQAARRGWAIQEAPLDRVLQARAAQVNWKALTLQATARMAAKVTEGPGLTLPAVQRPRTRLADPAMRLERPFSVQGRVLTEAGRTVNPLTITTLPYRYLIVDGTEPKHLNLARRLLSEQTDRRPLRVMVTRGDWRTVARALRVQRVFWADAPLLQRWHVEAVPSLVQQVGPMLQIQEVVT